MMLMRNRLPLLLLTLAASSLIASSQISSGNDSIYKLPYKNTYVKNVFVTDNLPDDEAGDHSPPLI